MPACRYWNRRFFPNRVLSTDHRHFKRRKMKKGILKKNKKNPKKQNKKTNNNHKHLRTHKKAIQAELI